MCSKFHATCSWTTNSLDYHSCVQLPRVTTLYSVLTSMATLPSLAYSSTCVWLQKLCLNWFMAISARIGLRLRMLINIYETTFWNPCVPLARKPYSCNPHICVLLCSKLHTTDHVIACTTCDNFSSDSSWIVLKTMNCLWLYQNGSPAFGWLHLLHSIHQADGTSPREHMSMSSNPYQPLHIALHHSIVPWSKERRS